MPKGDPIHKIARDLEGIPAASASSIEKRFESIAERHGGRFVNGRFPLRGTVNVIDSSGERVTLRLAGEPAGFWSIKSYGRGPVRPMKKRALDIGGARPFARVGPAAGNGAWDNAVDDLVRELDGIIGDELAKI